MSHTPSLYSPLIEFARLMQLLEANEGEYTPEIEAALALNEQNIATRTASLLDLVDLATANIEMARQKEAQAANFRKVQEKFIERVTNVLTVATQQHGPIQCGTRKVTLGKSEAVLITDKTLLPAEFKGPIIVQEAAPDKNRIKKALKDGQQVPGAQLETRFKAQIR